MNAAGEGFEGSKEYTNVLDIWISAHLLSSSGYLVSCELVSCVCLCLLGRLLSLSFVAKHRVSSRAQSDLETQGCIHSLHLMLNLSMFCASPCNQLLIR